MYNKNYDNYFAYKKNKLNAETTQLPRKKSQKFTALFKLFFATFIVMFIVIIVLIMNYSSRMDIEYTKGELTRSNTDTVNTVSGYENYTEDEQRKIDSRLTLIQQEENAPSEAKIILDKGDVKEESIIDPIHIEESKKIDKIEKQKLMNEQTAQEKQPLKFGEIKNKNSSTNDNIENNVTIMSKVLIGRFSSFEEAQTVQNEIKSRNPSLSPYVKKIGNIYGIQMGSYQDFSAAKNQAQALKSEGYDVWIYQQ